MLVFVFWWIGGALGMGKLVTRVGKGCTCAKGEKCGEKRESDSERETGK